MKIDYLKSLSVPVVALTAVSCDNSGDVAVLLMVTTIGVIAVVIIIFVVNSLRQEEREREKRRQEWQAKMKAEKEVRVKAYESGLAALRSEFGDADKTIALAEYDLNSEIRVYSGQRAITILGKTYDFWEILSCSCTDDYSVVKGGATINADSHTMTDTGSLIGRSVVGGLIGGEAGALIGGATASKNTSMSGTIKYSDDRLRHNYTVWVTVQNIAAPTIEIHTGADTRLTNEVVSLMNVIITGNQKI